jgi:hypothetical protein
LLSSIETQITKVGDNVSALHPLTTFVGEMNGVMRLKVPLAACLAVVVIP